MEFSVPRLAKFLHLDSSKEVKKLSNSLFPTLLCYAARTNDLNLVGILAQYGAKPSIPDYNGRTPLHVAASLGHIELLKYFIENGADVDARSVTVSGLISSIINIFIDSCRH